MGIDYTFWVGWGARIKDPPIEVSQPVSPLAPRRKTPTPSQVIDRRLSEELEGEYGTIHDKYAACNNDGLGFAQGGGDMNMRFYVVTNWVGLYMEDSGRESGIQLPTIDGQVRTGSLELHKFAARFGFDLEEEFGWWFDLWVS